MINTHRTFRYWQSAKAGLLFTLASAHPAAAQDETWDFTGYFYLWGATLGGSTTTGQDIDLSFSDIVDNLDFGIMGALEAKRDRLFFFGDFLYLNLGDEQTAAVGPGLPAEADADVEGTVFTGVVGHDIISDDDNRFGLMGGFRVMDLDTEANIAIAGGSERVSGGLNNWDLVVGLRGSSQLADRWRVSYYADIGAGDSALTWQISAAFDYRINNWDLSFGYRHLTWEIDNSDVLEELTFDGPFIGAKVRF